MPGDEAGAPAPRKSGDASLGIALVLLAGVVLYLTSSIEAIGFAKNSDPGPRVFPIGLAIVLGAGGIRELLGARRHTDAGGGDAGDPASRMDFGKLARLLGAILVYVALLPWLGFALSTLLMATVMMMMLGNPARMAVPVSVVMAGVVYVVFVVFFKVPLPGGIFGLPF